MLRGFGANLAKVQRAFQPEGGAYDGQNVRREDEHDES
jgi:urease accessory protein UreE